MKIELLGKSPVLARNRQEIDKLRPVLSANAEMGSVYANNATLRHEEWQTVDEAVTDVLDERLTVLDDMRALGLIEPVSIGTIIRLTERLEKFDPADLSYDGATPPTEDRPSYLNETTPVPVISKGFRFNWRQLISSRERGEGLDMTATQQSTRVVQDRIQDLITNGVATGGPQGGGIPGFTTATNRITQDLGTNWDDTGADPVGDVLDMLALAFAQNLFGPFYVYVPKNFWAALQADYSANKGDNTIIQRLLALSEIAAVRPLDSLANDNVVMVQMTSQVLDMSEAQGITTVQWQVEPWVTNFRVLYVGGPHIKSIETAAGDTVNGIVHLRPAP